MGLHVDVWSDFVCPWCYLVSTSLEKLKASHGITITWKSYELRPQGSPPMSAAYMERIQAAQPQLRAIASEHYGIAINHGKLGINSRPALIGMKFAEKQGKGDAYHQAVFEAYFTKAQNIEEHTVLGAIAVASGLDHEAFLAALSDSELDSAVSADVLTAHEYQISSVPALIFENKFYIPGAQPYPELVRFVEQMEQRLGLRDE
jgi:predicted DsbA family dithiol-disulfide isomerase